MMSSTNRESPNLALPSLFYYPHPCTILILLQIETLTLERNSITTAMAALDSAKAVEIEKNKVAIQATKGAEGLVEELRNSVEDLQGEIKRLKRCTDSQSRDLKRVIREKDALEKALQVSNTAATEAASVAASAAAASASAASRRNSDCPPPQVDSTFHASEEHCMTHSNRVSLMF
jgi:peptidoglycan hydrolase CwlO-like protein